MDLVTRRDVQLNIFHLMKRLASFFAFALSSLAACAAGDRSYEPMWSIGFALSPNVCVTDLRYQWGNLSVLNRVGAGKRRIEQTICGGDRGNGIGTFDYSSPLPASPLELSYMAASGTKQSYSVDVRQLFSRDNLAGGNLFVSIADGNVTVALRVKKTKEAITRTVPPQTPSGVPTVQSGSTSSSRLSTAHGLAPLWAFT
jgi:hypothetical protein